MQAIMETAFDVIYLTGVTWAGIILCRKARGDRLAILFGAMAIVLGVGDAFHLIPRIYALWTTGLAANAALLGLGKLITSVTMTGFYLMLYFVWKERYGIRSSKGLDGTMWTLAAVRILLCLFPQNGWFSHNPPLFWGILRNLPFTAMGILIIYLFMVKIRERKDAAFRFMPLAITLSFGFYIPVVLLADKYPFIGFLMMPKTLAYVWVIYMGYRLTRK